MIFITVDNGEKECLMVKDKLSLKINNTSKDIFKKELLLDLSAYLFYLLIHIILALLKIIKGQEKELLLIDSINIKDFGLIIFLKDKDKRLILMEIHIKENFMKGEKKDKELIHGKMVLLKVIKEFSRKTKCQELAS